MSRKRGVGSRRRLILKNATAPRDREIYILENKIVTLKVLHNAEIAQAVTAERERCVKAIEARHAQHDFVSESMDFYQDGLIQGYRNSLKALEAK